MHEMVYVETSIFSFYYDRRTSPEIVARHQWTRQWWDQDRHRYTLVTSLAAVGELRLGNLPHQAEAWKLAQSLPSLPTPEGIQDIVDLYVQHHLMPKDPLGDALHLALASYHKCDFLLTRNCRHLANANKFGHIRRVNALLGLHIPTLVTPLELLGVGDEDDD